VSEARILGSVGSGGDNRPDDVRVVQDLLNRAAGAGLDVDGDCGPKTVGAITEYQKGFTRRPDGRVDPEGLTLRKLRAGVADGRTPTGQPERSPAQGAPAAPAGGPSTGTRLQPLGTGKGFYSYSKPDRQFGSDPLLAALRAVGTALAKAGLEYGVGDLSFEQGGAMSPHKTHTSGHHADLRPIRNDGAHAPTSIGDPSYSRDSTRALVEALQSQPSVKQILFNDSDIPGVKHWPAHDNHLHIQVK
jgi:peptidoglycan hydrolase-like protein with peptidoglycan-binding domain